MSLLFRVIYAAHASGSHHKLAMDALEQLRSHNAEGWRRVFLKHADLYLKGSKDPDNEFKDFKNHVLHVEDGYWGGAIDKTQAWYGHFVAALKSQDWPQAVYCAGVLSHYFVDPIMPFHTGQSDAESNIHRAVEWSISKAYDSLRTERNMISDPLMLQPVESADWLKDLVCRGAERSHKHYHTLLVHYDFHKGVVDPPAGLDPISRAAVAELLTYASASFALVLDRAFAEADVAPPDVALSLDTLLATLAIPRKWIINKLADAADRRQVEAMYDELQATGKVDKTLSEDDRTVRDLYAAEVAGKVKAERAATRADRIRRAPAAQTTPPKLRVVEKASPVSTPVPAAGISKALAPSTSVPSAGMASTTSSTAPILYDAAHDETVERKPRLKASDAVEDAPSIGLKTAARLAKIGIVTVADLLAIDPDAAAGKLDTRHITHATIRDWQDQARFAMTIPNLSGTKAQLLVGSGHRDVAALAKADASTVRAAIAAFAATSEGERALRGGKLPDVAEIQRWVEYAKGVASRAA